MLCMLLYAILFYNANSISGLVHHTRSTEGEGPGGLRCVDFRTLYNQPFRAHSRAFDFPNKSLDVKCVYCSLFCCWMMGAILCADVHGVFVKVASSITCIHYFLENH